ncbi:MAG: integrase [Micropruina sp.]|uniref:integrase n=1 Tax=Micropruina sp. TaxID=2737536 RepID=UPI0039E3DEBE
MSARHEVAKQFARTYAQADKARKGELLDALAATTGWTRDHSRRAIRQAALDHHDAGPRSRKPKPRKYSDDALAVLQEVWRLTGRPSGKYLAAVMDDILNRLIRFAELDQVGARLTPEVLDEVRSMSAATIDRYLKPHRVEARPASPAVPNLSQILRPSSHVCVAAGRPTGAALLEVKAVAHCGDDPTGEFLWTVAATDPMTGWTQLRTAANRSVRDIAAAMDWIAGNVVLPLGGVVVGTGADEFIRGAVADWAHARNVEMVGVPDRGDDLADSGQRRTGRRGRRARYRTDAERRLLDELWEVSAARKNHLVPCVKAVGWIQSDVGRKRLYDAPRTPYRRLVEQRGLAPAARARLDDEHARLNPAQITRDIERVQDELRGIAEPDAEPTAG